VSCWVNCSRDQNNVLVPDIEKMDSVYARTQNQRYFFKGQLFNNYVETLEVYQEDNYCYFVCSSGTDGPREYKTEIGFLGDVQLIDLNNDRKNEVLVKTFSGNSADDYLLFFQDNVAFLKLVDFFFGETFVLQDFDSKKYLVMYQANGCSDLSWNLNFCPLRVTALLGSGK
jgi:hypothetical protein